VNQTSRAHPIQGRTQPRAAPALLSVLLAITGSSGCGVAAYQRFAYEDARAGQAALAQASRAAAIAMDEASLLQSNAPAKARESIALLNEQRTAAAATALRDIDRALALGARRRQVLPDEAR